MISQSRRHPDLLAVVAAAPVLAAVCVLVHVPLIRVCCAIPLCLLFPGYTVSAAVFAKSSLELPAKLMLVLGLSLVTLVIGGLLLNSAPGGLRTSSWVVALLAVIIVASAVAVRRRGERPVATRFPTVSTWRPGRSQVINASVLALALIIAVGAVIASRIPLGAPNTVGYETLTLVPLSHDRGVRLEVLSARQHTESYRLTVDVSLTQLPSRTLRLRPGQSFSLTVPLPPSPVPRDVRASVVMLGGHFTPRQVHLQLPADGHGS